MALKRRDDTRHVAGRRRNTQLAHVDQRRSFTASWPPIVQHGVRLPRPRRSARLAIVLRPMTVVLGMVPHPQYAIGAGGMTPSKIAVTMEIYTHIPSELTRNALHKLGDSLDGLT